MLMLVSTTNVSPNMVCFGGSAKTTLFPGGVFFLKKGKVVCSLPALFIFTNILWPPEYFVVLISEHAIYKKKE